MVNKAVAEVLSGPAGWAIVLVAAYLVYEAWQSSNDDTQDSPGIASYWATGVAAGIAALPIALLIAL